MPDITMLFSLNEFFSSEHTAKSWFTDRMRSFSYVLWENVWTDFPCVFCGNLLQSWTRFMKNCSWNCFWQGMECESGRMELLIRKKITLEICRIFYFTSSSKILLLSITAILLSILLVYFKQQKIINLHPVTQVLLAINEDSNSL